jgi:biotin carboxyl carrier protein
MRDRWQDGDGVMEVVARPRPAEPQMFDVVLGGQSYSVRAVRTREGVLLLELPDGRRIRAAVSRDGDRRWVSLEGRTATTQAVHEGGSTAPGTGGLEAPMPGKVIEVCVAVGDRVEVGQRMVVVEAMKMEHAIVAPHDGTVIAVDASEGAMVQPGRPLVRLEAVSS